MANYQYNSTNSINLTGSMAGNAINSLPAITISSLNGHTGISAQSLSLSDDYIYNAIRNSSTNVKRYQVAETSEDILALSVAWKRIRSTPILSGISSLLDDNLFSEVTEEDRITANAIRDYFSKKVMLWSLKDIKLTKFRQDMSDLIHNDGKKINEAYLPIAFKLPEFYEYDIAFDKFKQEINPDISNFDELCRKPVLSNVKTLTPIKSFYRSNKRSKHYEYWFKDVHNTAHLILIEPRNPLMHIWDKMFAKGEMHIEGTYSPKQADDLQYYKILKWTLI